jgi:hypothetical protein
MAAWRGKRKSISIGEANRNELSPYTLRYYKRDGLLAGPGSVCQPREGRAGHRGGATESSPWPPTSLDRRAFGADLAGGEDLALGLECDVLAAAREVGVRRRTDLQRAHPAVAREARVELAACGSATAAQPAATIETAVACAAHVWHWSCGEAALPGGRGAETASCVAPAGRALRGSSVQNRLQPKLTAAGALLASAHARRSHT